MACINCIGISWRCNTCIWLFITCSSACCSITVQHKKQYFVKFCTTAVFFHYTKYLWFKVAKTVYYINDHKTFKLKYLFLRVWIKWLYFRV